MRNRHSTHRGRGVGRRGIATLEFVMALPVLLLLMVGITWLGFSVIGQTEVVVEARNQAWQKRFVNKKQEPLMFPVELGDLKNPKYAGDADFVTEKVSKRIDVSPVFSLVPGPESSHTILSGSWDHSAMPFDRLPNLKLAGIAVINAKTGKFQSAAAIVTNIKQLLKDAVAEALAQAAAKITGLGGKPGSGTIEDLASAPDPDEDEDAGGQGSTGGGPSGGGSAGAGGGVPGSAPGSGNIPGKDTPAEDQQANQKAELTKERDRLKAEIEEVDRELEPLLRDIGQGSGIPLTDEQRAEQRSKMHRLGLLQTKKKRLESDLRDVEAELKAAG